MERGALLSRFLVSLPTPKILVLFGATPTPSTANAPPRPSWSHSRGAPILSPPDL